LARPHAVLLREMRLALYSELGARAIYADLARLTRDAELRGVLEGLVLEQQAQLERISSVMQALGARPPLRSLRRRLLAGLLALTAPLVGRRLVLRICAQAADKAARWHAYFQLCLLHAGLDEHAAACAHLSETRRRHARVLDAWVWNL